MEDPASDIEQVVVLVSAAVDPEIQNAAVARYYAPDAAFRHPLCAVPAGADSRAAILGILHWYRVLSPRISITVQRVTYNPDANELFLDIVQSFHIRWSPFQPKPARLVTHLKLREGLSAPNGSPRFIIAEHEDFYHPDDFIALLVPPLVPFTRALLALGALSSNVLARIGGCFGLWKVQQGEGRRVGEPQPEHEPPSPDGLGQGGSERERSKDD